MIIVLRLPVHSRLVDKVGETNGLEGLRNKARDVNEGCKFAVKLPAKRTGRPFETLHLAEESDIQFENSQLEEVIATLIDTNWSAKLSPNARTSKLPVDGTTARTLPAASFCAESNLDVSWRVQTGTPKRSRAFGT